MSSGIYRMTFSDGSFYIGKSADINKRWAQHSKALSKGTHTKKLQDAYNKFGAPEFEVIFECHPDHIDILETYFINDNWGSTILNSTKPAEISEKDLKVLTSTDANIWKISTFDHILEWREASAQKDKYELILSRSKNAKKLVALEEELLECKKEINRLKSRGWFKRLFNL